MGFNNRVYDSARADTPPHWVMSDMRFAPKENGWDERPLHLLDPGSKLFYDGVLVTWEPAAYPEHTAFKAE